MPPRRSETEACHKILRNCRAAMDPGGRVLLVEMVLPTGAEPHRGEVLDVIMPAIPRRPGAHSRGARDPA